MKPRQLSTAQIETLSQIASSIYMKIYEDSYCQRYWISNTNKDVDRFIEYVNNFCVEDMFVQLDLHGIDHPTSSLPVFAAWLLQNSKSRSDVEILCKMILLKCLPTLTRGIVRLFRKSQISQMVEFFLQIDSSKMKNEESKC